MKTLKANSFIGRFYKFMFDDTLPETTCQLYRNTILSILLLPMAISAAFPLRKDESWDQKTLIGKWFNGCIIWISSILIAALGLGVLNELHFTFWKELPFL